MAKQLSTEEEINLRRKTRRRLIGAIALTLVVVVLLPVIFDDEPVQDGEGMIELRIPDQDAAPAFQPKIDLPEMDKMSSESAATSAAAAAMVETPLAAPAAESEPATPVVSKPESKPKVESAPKAETKPKADAKAAAKPQSVVVKSGWVVQVGAFANVETAKNLQTKLSKQGYHAYTEKAGNVVRVRVGGYPTREAAEKVQHKLETQGLHPNVINLG